VAQVSIPLYPQGVVSSRVRAAKQRNNRRRLEIDESRRDAEETAITAWEALVTARAQLDAFEAEVRATTIALEGVRQENAVGARTILDILDAEQEALDSQVNLTRAKRDEIVANFQVLFAMGRLTARYLGLPVEVYNPESDYQAVRDLWYGLTPPGQ
jgi:outer membrane protein TolC